MHAQQFRPTSDAVDYMMARYDEEIFTADRAVGALVEGLKANLDAATTNAAIKAADDVFVKNAAGLPDDVADDLQKRIAAARRRVKGA